MFKFFSSKLTQSKDSTNGSLEKPPTFVAIVMVVGFYIFTSITMVLLNKAVLNRSSTPLTFLWGQLIVAVILLHIASFLGLLTLPVLTLPIVKSLVPLIGINVIGLALNTLCLHKVDAAIYQVARSLILPITVILSPVILKQRISSIVGISCAVITTGFLIGMFGERKIQVSAEGIVFGILSSLTTALHSFVIKKSFTSVSNNGAFDLVYYNNLLSSIPLLPVLFYEYKDLTRLFDSGGLYAIQMFLFGTFLAGASGLLINLAGFLQIKITSPMTHTVSSAARGVLQSIAAHIVLNEVITIPRCIGIGITLAGSAFYSWAKNRESARPEYLKVETKSENS